MRSHRPRRVAVDRTPRWPPGRATRRGRRGLPGAALRGAAWGWLVLTPATASGRRWLRKARRAPFPLYQIENWPGQRFVVEQSHTGGRLAELTAGFADADPAGATDIRVTTTRRPPSRSDDRMPRHLDPWLAAVVGEARGLPRMSLVADPESAVELTSAWQTMRVPVDDEPVAFRVRSEDAAWVAYTHRADHTVIVCAEHAASLPPESLRLATVRDLAAFERGSAARRRRRLG